jgi:cell division protein FtsQ
MPRPLPIPRWIAVTAAVAVVLTLSVYAYLRVEQFLIRDTRFTFSGPNTDGSLEVSGATHVKPHAIEGVFSDDFGRSAYLIPLDERRASLRTVAWVKDASVARFWPNHVVVGVTERKPVAFLTAPAGRPWLIDSEGVILPPVEDRFTLPVLIGVHASDPLELRRDRVGRLMALMKDLGAAGRSASAVDVSDPDDLKLSEPLDGRIVTLLLGDRDFALRHDNFVRYYSEIRKKMPDAAVLDLRVEDRITVVPPKGEQ